MDVDGIRLDALPLEVLQPERRHRRRVGASIEPDLDRPAGLVDAVEQSARRYEIGQVGAVLQRDAALGIARPPQPHRAAAPQPESLGPTGELRGDSPRRRHRGLRLDDRADSTDGLGPERTIGDRSFRVERLEPEPSRRPPSQCLERLATELLLDPLPPGLERDRGEIGVAQRLTCCGGTDRRPGRGPPRSGPASTPCRPPSGPRRCCHCGSRPAAGPRAPARPRPRCEP